MPASHRAILDRLSPATARRSPAVRRAVRRVLLQSVDVRTECLVVALVQHYAWHPVPVIGGFG